MNEDLMEKELRRDEGVRYVRYLDSRGIPTTGVGHNLNASPLPAGWAFPLNDQQVNQLYALHQRRPSERDGGAREV
ncbi:hypothetical protein WI72_33705 [Burkholderia ubonensis]|uniref:hypothetical protein n=1 Tax=Burkholderia ubonensis TaxID=101571 RepID=UPI00075AFE54|nr:hypothetical protein [Burkholderia ubonensis]KVC65532.1 hypothetical protein WI72_33705 [Burkholderia ubonensis]